MKARGRPKGTPKTGGRIKSTDTQLPAVRVTKVQAEIAQAAGGGVTSEGVRLALELLALASEVIEHLEAHSEPGNKAEELAQRLRAKGFSAEVQEAIEPIVILRPDGEVAAWIA